MIYYQRKPIQDCEARQLTADNQAELLAWTNGNPGLDGRIRLRWKDGENSQVAERGDYIVKEGEDFTVFTQAVFNKLYQESPVKAPDMPQPEAKEEAPEEDVSKRTLEDKLKLPYVKVDLACGLNRHERELNEHIYIDGDPDENLDIVCDWNNIPLETGIVDVIHFSDAIEHVRTWEADKTMGEINRILKIGGLFYGTTPNRDFIMQCALNGSKDEEWIHRNLYGDGAGYGHTHYQTFTKPNLKAFLEKYGFGEVEFGGIEDWISFSCKKVANV